jgi:hypothetical protein
MPTDTKSSFPCGVMGTDFSTRRSSVANAGSRRLSPPSRNGRALAGTVASSRASDPLRRRWASGAVYKITIGRDDLKLTEMGAPIQCQDEPEHVSSLRFFHCWGTGPAEKLAMGFKAALDHLRTTKSTSAKD